MLITHDTELNKVIKEDIHITKSSTLNARGIISGNVNVDDDSVFNLYGILNGNLFASEGATVYIHGIMNGDIISSDGHIELSGILNTKSVVPNNIIKIKGCYINNIKF